MPALPLFRWAGSGTEIRSWSHKGWGWLGKRASPTIGLQWEQLHGSGFPAPPPTHSSPTAGEGRASVGKEETNPQPSHLLEEPDVQNREGGVQQVEEHQEPAFIQRLGRGGMGECG